jgi:large subunit ribosomal protein L21
MNYAIIEISGRQFWVEPKKYYLINHIPFKFGTKLFLKRILLVNQEKKIEIGYPYLNNVKIEAVILNHLKEKKVIVYKMKPKKKYRRKNGYRSKLTKLLIESINLK